MVISTLFRNYGAPILLSRLNALVKEIPGVRAAKDIEYIHRMRVASRRLRRALDVFGECFPAKSVKRWTKRIKRITKTLGAARDLDVQIAFLSKEKRILPAQSRTGIERIILRLSQQRAHEQEAVTAALDTIEREGVLKSMEEFIRIATSLAALAPPAPSDIIVRKKAHTRLLGLLANMLSYETYVRQSERALEHHEMRIAAKFLRYELEIFEGLFGGGAKRHLELIKGLQAILGELHDCDIWIEYLPVFIEQERALTDTYFGHTRGFARVQRGIMHLIDDRKKKRRECHAQFVSFWERTTAEKAWREMKISIDRLLERKAPAAKRPVKKAPAVTASAQTSTKTDIGK